MSFYFEAFDHRVPPEPLAHAPTRERVWQALALLSLVLGAWYLVWRWGWSLNRQALWFAVPLVLAETLAYLGTVLFVFNLWRIRDTPGQPPPETMADCVDPADAEPRRMIVVDVLITTYTEDPDLVRFSIRDALRITYPHPLDLRIYVLDDGRRAMMRQVAEEEGVGYITRPTNAGFKAGNLHHAMEQTAGDFVVICDADTRPFPTLLAHTLGYFRDPAVAWVQTPQWFYDVPEGYRLADQLARWGGGPGRAIGRGIERLFGPVRVGADPFHTNARFFYDVIQRRRNWANASFCCGAGSIQRREALMCAAVRRYADQVEAHVMQAIAGERDPERRAAVAAAARRARVLEADVRPFIYHVSEDIYTSILLHADPTRRWKSVLHPRVESKMLSPQDLQAWLIQQFKYAGGSLDIALRHPPLLRGGLTFPQHLMYLATFWSYLACLWNVVFLVAPIIYFVTGVAPVTAYSGAFFRHQIPFLVVNELAFAVGLWGLSPLTGRAMHLASFPLVLRALVTVLKGEKIKFPITPKRRQQGTFLHLVQPQLGLVALSVLAWGYGVIRELTGATHNLAGFWVNTVWLAIGVLFMITIIRAALWRPPAEHTRTHAC